MIPKNLYLIWFGPNKPSNLSYVAQMYKKINTEFNVHVIAERNPDMSSNKDIKICLELISRNDNKYAEIFNSIYATDSSKYNIALSEAFRCFMLDTHGGIYVDCDTFPVMRFTNKLLQNRYFHGAVVKTPKAKPTAVSYFIGATAGNDVYPAHMLNHSTTQPAILVADKLWEAHSLRYKLIQKFKACQLKFGQTHEQFVTQYVNHYGKMNDMNMYRDNGTKTSVSRPISLGSILDGEDSKPQLAYSNRKTIDKISVVFITHERTNVVKYTLQNLITYLKFDGQIHWVIADDRSSDSHIAEIKHIFIKNGITDYIICKTVDQKNHGLGSNMNNGLSEAFSFSPVVLTAEDDFALEKTLDLTKWANFLDQHECAMIRLAYKERKNKKVRYTDDLDAMSGNKVSPWIFNNQVALRHKRIYDAIGMYPENASPDRTEITMRDRYNKLTNYGESAKYKILIPHCIKEDTFDHPSLWFIHIGKSTCNHLNYTVPQRYMFLYDDQYANNGSFNLTVDQLLKNSFVISINQDRIDQFNRIFDKAGLTPIPNFFEGFSNSDIKSGPYKCEMSHAAVIKTAKALDLPFVCIFEDDAFPAIDVVNKLKINLMNIPSYTKILLIGWLDEFSRVRRENGFFGVGNAYGSHAYIVFKSGYDEYLAAYKKNPNIVADQFNEFVDKTCLLRTQDNMFIQFSTGSMHGFNGYALGNNINKNCLKEPPTGFYPISYYD